MKRQGGEWEGRQAKGRVERERGETHLGKSIREVLQDDERLDAGVVVPPIFGVDLSLGRHVGADKAHDVGVFTHSGKC
jgi:hypothetical protein